MRVSDEGIIFAITGPSGAGKTTYTKLLSNYYKNTSKKSLGYCTRKKRPNEKEGEQYYFITEQEFKQKIKDGEFACYTEFCGNKCGITKEYIRNVIKEQKKDLFFDTVMNLAEVRKLANKVIIIFLEAPIEELELRIRNRDNTISEIEIGERIKMARQQLEFSRDSDFIVKTDSNYSEAEVLKKLIRIVENIKIKGANNET